MPYNNPPIKRSTELAPLSREHHEGLLFVWKIKQGLQSQVELQRIADFVHWFWTIELALHFEKEEKVLIPFLGKKMSLKERLLDEHAVIKKLIHEIEETATNELLQKLAEVINDHIRFEERILFKHIEVTVSSEELKVIGAGLAEPAKEVKVWEDEFWVK